ADHEVDELEGYGQCDPAVRDGTRVRCRRAGPSSTTRARLGLGQRRADVIARSLWRWGRVWGPSALSPARARQFLVPTSRRLRSHPSTAHREERELRTIHPSRSPYAVHQVSDQIGDSAARIVASSGISRACHLTSLMPAAASALSFFASAAARRPLWWDASSSSTTARTVASFRHTTKSALMRSIRLSQPRASAPLFTPSSRDSWTCASTMDSGSALTSRKQRTCSG